MLQASEGGRVYLGRSALEIKLREMPGSNSDAVPMPMASTPTERISRFMPAELPSDAKLIELEKGLSLSRSTLAGLCLTAFACGIVATVAIDRVHFRAEEKELRERASQAVVVAPAAEPPPVAPPVLADATVKPAVAALPAGPVVVQMAPLGAVSITPAVPAVPARAAVARTPRPPAIRTVARRRPSPISSTASAADADGAETPASNGGVWVDPFAQ